MADDGRAMRPPTWHPAQRDHTGGKPEHIPTRETRLQVHTLASCSTSHKVIALFLGISRGTLEKHYAEELEIGFEFVKATVQAAMAQRAMAGDLGCAKFWLARWCPEWRLPKEDSVPLGEGDDTARDQERVRFYLPSNGRDKPEEPEQIEGKIEDAA